tara:strand:- start:5089 stop:7821 length:2733 start_codon:yes stop_codon:yes gene_type:complete
MTIKNPKLFGLAVTQLLADVKNKNTAIQNLGLNPLDIEVIKGANNANMNRFDWISFSRLKTPIYKSLDRFLNESKTFNGILLNRAGTDQTLFGNLDINGSLSGSAIRYRYRDFDANNFRIADISTSRVSAWSSSDSRANNSNLSTQKLARISYGARVGIIQGGKLEFEKQSTATVPLGNASSNTAPQTGILGPAGQPRLQTTIVPEVKEFPSEVPTSRIKCSINGTTVYLYAMKGIPLVFKGFFRNLDAEIRISTAVPKASWKIVETANENLYTNFVNQGTTTSSINYRSPISRERFIKFYYNPNKITFVRIRSANIRELPPTKLSSCVQLDFAFNQLKVFPNFEFIAPSLTTLQIMRNPFYLSDIENERNFNINVLNKIPTTLTYLEFEGCFPGTIERNIVSERLPNLRYFNCQRGGGVMFYPDSRPSGSVEVQVPDGSDSTTKITGNNAGGDSFCPDVPIETRNYYLGNNDFRNVDLNKIEPGQTANNKDGVGIAYTGGSCSFKTLPNLVNISVANNYNLRDTKSLTDPSDTDSVSTALESANQNKIETINYSNTYLGIPSNLNGCISLRIYNATYNRGHKNSLLNGATYAFSGCVALTQLNFYATNLGLINFPNFDNELLDSLDLRYTNIKGGAPGLADAAQTRVITSNTFKLVPELRVLRILSGNLLSKDIDPDAFKLNTKLQYFYYNSGGNSTGPISNLFNTCGQLIDLSIVDNSFSGPPPNLSNNLNIQVLNLRKNKLSGTIPGFANLNSLRGIYLQTNVLTKINAPGALPALTTYQAQNNSINDQVPDFSGCNNLRSLVLNNNKFYSYKIGAVAKNYKLNYLDLSFNNLSSTALDNILVDLLANWNSINRGRVTINLKNQTSTSNPNITIFPSETGYAAARILVSKGWSIGLTGGIPDEPDIV